MEVVHKNLVLSKELIMSIEHRTGCVSPMSPGFDSQMGVLRWLNLLTLYSAPRGFSPGTPVFPSPQKQCDLKYINLI